MGSWWCSPGGWPSPNPKAHTEVFYVAQGHASITDADGVKHYFGPGDTVIIPKGHSGRWDVYQDIHKIWLVNDHANIEERSSPIRVKVIHYQDYHINTGAPQGYGAALSSNLSASRYLYDVGPTKVGIWTENERGTVYKVTSTERLSFLVLQGVVVLSTHDGAVQRLQAGDTVVLPKGWSGYLDVVEPVKKLWTQAN